MWGTLVGVIALKVALKVALRVAPMGQSGGAIAPGMFSIPTR